MNGRPYLERRVYLVVAGSGRDETADRIWCYCHRYPNISALSSYGGVCYKNVHNISSYLKNEYPVHWCLLSMIWVRSVIIPSPKRLRLHFHNFLLKSVWTKCLSNMLLSFLFHRFFKPLQAGRQRPPSRGADEIQGYGRGYGPDPLVFIIRYSLVLMVHLVSLQIYWKWVATMST